MAKKLISYPLKQKIIEIAGNCFWYWNNLYVFLESCGVEREHYLRYKGQGLNKYHLMRNIISDLEDKDDLDTLLSIQSNLYNLQSIPDANVPDEKKAKKLLQEFKELCSEDLLTAESKRRESNQKREQRLKEIAETVDYQQRLREIYDHFLGLCSMDDPHKRGFELEQLIYDLFALNEIEFHKSYKTDDEQIDGYFCYDNFHYLLETKWVKEQIRQDELAIFDKKIDKKLQSTRGFFLSMNGFTDDAISAYSGHKPRLILMHGEDLTLILDCHILLEDALRAKIENAVKNGNVFFKLRNLK